MLVIWQDYLFAFAAVLILVGLVPNVTRRVIMPVSATAPIFFAVVCIALGMYSLHLWISGSLTALQALCWGYLMYLGARE